MKKCEKTVAVMLVLLFATAALAGCAPAESKPAPEPVEAFVLPETRVVANDLLAAYPFYSLNANHSSGESAGFPFSSPLMAKEIKAPVAIVMREQSRSDDWFFAKTDIIDTVQDIGAANSVLYVYVRPGEDNDGTFMKYEVSFADAQFQAVFAACTAPDDADSSISIRVNDEDASQGIAQADEIFFKELSQCVSITASAATDVSGVLAFLGGVEVNNPAILDAVRQYAYPEDERLSNNTEALRGYASHVYKTIGGVPGDTDETAYVRQPGLFDDVNARFSLGTNDVANYSGAAQGEPYLIVFYERIGAEQLGDYMPPLLTYVCRATAVDSATKQVVAWETGCFRFEGEPPEHVYSVEEVDGMYLYTGEDARDPFDVISPWLSMG